MLNRMLPLIRSPAGVARKGGKEGAEHTTDGSEGAAAAAAATHHAANVWFPGTVCCLPVCEA